MGKFKQLERPFTALSFSGGGGKTEPMIGIIEELKNKQSLDAVTDIWGCSGGAIIGAATALGNSTIDIEIRTQQLDKSFFGDKETIFGFLGPNATPVSGAKLLADTKAMVHDSLKPYGFDENITVAQFYVLVDEEHAAGKTKLKYPHIAVTEYTFPDNEKALKQSPRIREVTISPKDEYGWEKYQNLRLVDAIQASGTVPGVHFAVPIEEANGTFKRPANEEAVQGIRTFLVDGGVTRNYAPDFFEDKKTLGACVAPTVGTKGLNQKLATTKVGKAMVNFGNGLMKGLYNLLTQSDHALETQRQAANSEDAERLAVNKIITKDCINHMMGTSAAKFMEDSVKPNTITLPLMGGLGLLDMDAAKQTKMKSQAVLKKHFSTNLVEKDSEEMEGEQFNISHMHPSKLRNFIDKFRPQWQSRINEISTVEDRRMESQKVGEMSPVDEQPKQKESSLEAQWDLNKSAIGKRLQRGLESAEPVGKHTEAIAKGKAAKQIGL